MIHFSLPRHDERIYKGSAFFPTEFPPARPALYSQWRTYQALTGSDASIVLNTYPTGSGKTKAALLYLTELINRPLSQANCLFIAPTNELLSQHAHDIASFCERNQLPHQVLLLTREKMDEYEQEIAKVAQGLSRRAAKLEALLKEPRMIADVRGYQPKVQQPYVLVTNPDIFYAAVFCRYGRNEVRPLLKTFLGGFDYLVIDEFHYYNPKQLANFLFFLTFWGEYGYFASGAKVCLLSATPSSQVRSYLEHLKVKIEEISPDNEPEHAPDTVIPSLAPVELDVLMAEEAGEGGLVDVVTRRWLSDIRGWIAQGEQGAIISGALWRINLIHDALVRARLEDVRRLTGVELRSARENAAKAQIILATPTVDLGYNFERQEKPRQSLDFLFFDASFADEFVQRLGRAGRVLGKREADTPSHAVAVVSQALLDALRPLDGQVVTRKLLRMTLQKAKEQGTLAERNALFDYIATGAIAEAFLPISRLSDMTASEDQDKIEALFERVREVFDVSPRYTFRRLTASTKRYLRHERIFRQAPTEDASLVPHVLKAPDNAGFQAFLIDFARERSMPPPEIQAKLKAAVSQPGTKAYDQFRAWAARTYRDYVTAAAAFSFRESFQPPLARVYDPHQFLSSADIANYDAFHVVQNCQAEFLTPAEWAKRSGTQISAEEKARMLLYCTVYRLREPAERLPLYFCLDCDTGYAAWERTYACQMTALLGLQVISDKGQLPGAVIDAVRNQYIPAFLAPSDRPIGGLLTNVARNYGMRQYDLEVRFAEGSNRWYRFVLGTFALLASARLRKACLAFHHRQEKNLSEPIWC
jgi:CRISPR-associated endonuclease/helicase Cas3